MRAKESERIVFDYLMLSPSEMKGILRGTEWQVGHLYKGSGPRYVAIFPRT